MKQAQLEVRRCGARVGLQRPFERLGRSPEILRPGQLLGAQEMRLALLVRTDVPRRNAAGRAQQQEQAGNEASARRKNHGAQRSETPQGRNLTHARGPPWNGFSPAGSGGGSSAFSSGGAGINGFAPAVTGGSPWRGRQNGAPTK